MEPLDIDAGLRRFRLPSFRPGQREAIETLLERKRLLLVAPTGGGKSLTYQLPATLLPGTTVVISPLIALMQDQVSALDSLRISATYLASNLDPAEMSRRMRALETGELKLIYVSPERLADSRFRACLTRVECPLVAVDEAHCISQWGHDFRPDYMQIRDFLSTLPFAHVLACTATATPVVRDEIIGRLGLDPSTTQLVQGFARPNLQLRALEVASAAGIRKAVDSQLGEALGSPDEARGAAIVYSPTRRMCEAESARLADAGWLADFYHAGRSSEERGQVSQAFMSGNLDIVVATNAFGMGIDRSDVRAVIHLAPPGSIEAYYHEVGRAGRDGLPAWGLLTYSVQEFPRRKRLLEKDPVPGEAGKAILEHKWQQFRDLMRWAEGGGCRHDAILRYFGDSSEELGGCGFCDVCEALSDTEDSQEQTTLIVRKALSGVARVHRKFGLEVATKLLAGVKDDRLRWSGLDQLSTFGVLKEYPVAWIRSLLGRCVAAGWVDFLPGDRPLIFLTPAGIEVMTGRRPARLLLPPERTRTKKAPTDAGKRETTRSRELPPGTQELFDRLREWRLERSRRDSVPPYVVASDNTLWELAISKPTTLNELLSIPGIGEKKVAMYGDEILAITNVENSQLGRVCDLCGSAIPPERIQALPETHACVDCQAKFEAGGANAFLGDCPRPKCPGRLIWRERKRGGITRYFVGCSEFPGCNHTQ